VTVQHFLHLKYGKTSLIQTTWDKDARLLIVQFRINQFFIAHLPVM